MSWRGLALGAIGLAVLDAVVSKANAAGNVGGWLEDAGNLVKKFLDPTVPFFTVTTSPGALNPLGVSPLSTTTPSSTSPSIVLA